MQKISNIKVYIRVRPPRPSQIDNQTKKFQSCLAVDKNNVYFTKDKGQAVIFDTETNNVTSNGSLKKIKFDGVFGENTTQD